MSILELKGKVDTLIQVSQLREQAQNLELRQIRDDAAAWRNDHEARLRLLEGRIPGSMEQRINDLEKREYVKPRTVYLATVMMITVGSLIVAIINLAIQ